MSTEVESVNPPVSIAEFQKASEYLALTENQKTWILKLIATKDARQATIETYPKARKLGPAYTSQLAGKLAASPKIRAAIARFYDWDERAKFLNDLEIDIRRAKGADKASLQLVRARVLGLLPSNDSTLPANQQTYAVGSLVEQNGQVFQITAVPVEVTR